MNHLWTRTEEIERREHDDGAAEPVEQALLPGQDDDAGDEDVAEGERDHPLPSEVHELIEAEAGEGRAEPDVHHHEGHDLRGEDDAAEDAAEDAPRAQ